MKDRALGVAIMDNVFDDEFIASVELDRKGGTGANEAVWTWSVED